MTPLSLSAMGKHFRPGRLRWRWVAACDSPHVARGLWCVRWCCSGGGWEWRDPGPAGEGVADDRELVESVFGGGGDHSADPVAVSGSGLGGEPAGGVLLGLGRADVTFGLVGGGRLSG